MAVAVSSATGPVTAKPQGGGVSAADVGWAVLSVAVVAGAVATPIVLRRRRRGADGALARPSPLFSRRLVRARRLNHGAEKRSSRRSRTDRSGLSSPSFPSTAPSRWSTTRRGPVIRTGSGRGIST